MTIFSGHGSSTVARVTLLGTGCHEYRGYKRQNKLCGSSFERRLRKENMMTLAVSFKAEMM